MLDRGQSNVIGGFLFIFALMILLSVMVSLSNQQSQYIINVNYRLESERERSHERIIVNITNANETYATISVQNTGGSTVKVNYIIVSTQTDFRTLYKESFTVVPPGEEREFGIEFDPPLNSTESIVFTLISERGNSYSHGWP